MSVLHDALRALGSPVRNEEDGFGREYRLEADFPGFAGHFPQHPVLPAVVQLLMARMTVENGLGRPLNLIGVPQAKFMLPLGPGLSVAVAVRPHAAWPSQAAEAGAGTLWNCVLRVEGRAAARFYLQLTEGA